MQNQLERKLGLWSVVALGIGATIGTGIFSTMSQVAEAAAGSALVLILAYVIGGALQIPCNFCYAELSSAYPENGGYYVYIREAGTQNLAFFCGWASFWALDPPSISIMSLGLVNYLSVLLPFDTIVLRCISVLVIIIFAITNIRSVEAGGITQAILTALKIIPFVVIIGIGLFFIKGELFTTSPNFVSDDSMILSVFAFFAAIATTTFSYDGMYAPSYMTGEIKNPKKVMPVAFITTAIVVILLYSGLSIVSCGLLSIDQLAQSPAPIAEVASKIPFIGGYAGTIVAIMAVMVIIGTISSVIMYQPRLGYSMAKDGYFFEVFAKVHPKYNSPYGAIIIHTIYAILLTFVGDLDILLGYFTLITLIRNFLTFASVFILRKKDSYKPSYKCPCGLLMPSIACIVTLLLIVGIFVSQPIESLIAIALLGGTGIIAYIIWKKRKVKAEK